MDPDNGERHPDQVAPAKSPTTDDQHKAQSTVPAALPVRMENVPADLRGIPRWVLWRWELRADKWTKPPHKPDGRYASSTDPSSWSTFDTVRGAYECGGFAGIGFVLTDDDDDIVGVDLDHCVTNGDAPDETLSIVAKLGSYTEVSPSGAGLRVLARAELPAGWRKHGDIEVYETGRYVTITGRRIGEIGEIRDRQEAIEAFHAEHGPPPPRALDVSPARSDLSDRDVLDLIERAANGARFAALYRGDSLDYPSASEADAAFIGMLAFYTRDEHQLDRIYHGSGRAREKWDERRGDQTYGQRTIRNVLARVTETYTPPSSGPQLVEAPVPNGTPEPELVVRRLSDVAPETVTFLWKGRIPVGKLTAIGGDPGLGKSYLTIALGAPVTLGVDLADVDLPDDGAVTEAGDVVIASFEDDAADTLRPRAELLGADLARVHVIEGVRSEDGKMRPFCPDDVDRLELLIAKLSHPRMLVIDPVGGWVGAGVDTYRDNEVRAALEGLRTLAARYRIAVLLVMHLRKSVAHNALARLSGSGAYGQLVRSALLVGKHPDDETMNALAHIKHNFAAKQPTLGYRIDDSGLHWTGVVDDVDGEQLVGHDFGDERTALSEATDWLVDLLRARGGQEFREEIVKLGKAEGFSESTLKRARRKAKVDYDRTQEPRPRTFWTLPKLGDGESRPRASRTSQTSQTYGAGRSNWPNWR